MQLTSSKQAHTRNLMLVANAKTRLILRESLQKLSVKTEFATNESCISGAPPRMKILDPPLFSGEHQNK